MKRCSLCGRHISAAEWEQLPTLGALVVPPYGDDPGEVLDLRNCDCGTTLSQLEPYTGATFEAAVALEHDRRPALTRDELRWLVFRNLHRNPRYYGVP